jgi:NAD(P)-dependent dehydrogenase (short-subunit alcohol dehydrogenase family)
LTQHRIGTGTPADYLTELFSLRGLVAAVTGGSSGIGRAMAEALAGAGASVVVVARRPAPLDDTVCTLRERGWRGAAVVADLGDRDAVGRAADQITSHFGEPDILVNSAANNIRPPMNALTTDDWDQSMALNLQAPFLLGQRFGPAMAERGWGRIINVASQQAFRAFGNSGAYGVSKGGITALTRSQAEAWSARGVCCNTVVPGFVITPLTAEVAADEERVRALAARTLIGRNSESDDFRGVTVFLASRAADYVTGQAIFVDGGFSAH